MLPVNVLVPNASIPSGLLVCSGAHGPMLPKWPVVSRLLWCGGKSGRCAKPLLLAGLRSPAEGRVQPAEMRQGEAGCPGGQDQGP